MKATLSSLAAGIVFGIGLAIAGMISPAKVIGILDIAGDWDPSLAFVMGGAVCVTVAGFALARRRGRPLFDATLQWPTATALDRRLVGGAALFGVGWGIAGYCPGPAIASIALYSPAALTFCGAMIIGMLAFELLERARRGKPDA